MSDFNFPKAASPAAARAGALGAQKTQKSQKTKRKPSSSAAPNRRTDSSNKTSALFETFPQLAQADVDQKMLVDILKKLEVDLFQNELNSEGLVIKIDEDQLQNLTKTNQKKFGDQLKKIEDRNNASVWSKVFGWLGAILGVVLGVVLAIVSFGTGATAAGVLITASVVLAVVMVIMTSTGAMEKMTQGLAKPLEDMLTAFGVDAKQAKRISEMVMQVVVAVVVIAAQITMAVLSGGASTANLASTIAQKVATITMKITNAVLALNQLAATAAQTASGVYNYEALSDLSDTEKDKALLKKIQTLIEDEKDTIKEILDILMATQKNMGSLIKDENDSRGKLADIDAATSAV